ncbi:UDP-4-amino-4,6-dideoxy-N-acetyl-beta-L-altrosamine N-acetyltransferase [Halalkalibacter alkalisediminis]|uniref:UDP-4-amino-4, 6-dideoxy-N-acetyl-beta-L-altrosamine N-acetyltransferase n=1 Tax=Halalkalibacter alkalisediminis TaxID=935616 RepID=A0ABV6NNY0_9BACI|nr:UDP-4-amino-4,6-dideoxy-N-acetyl-beta-L-altrosamine N-acetyltransferase [Halalkalibacter alkalisediminis]
MVDLSKYALKELEESDLKLILNWRNSKRIRNLMYTDHEITMTEHERWFQRITKDDSNLFKLLLYGNRRLGLVNFSNIDKMNNKCYWGFYIGDLEAPRGSGTIMGMLALDLVFEKMGLRKVCAEVLEFNSSSIRYHKKLGFKEEGRFIQHVIKNNQYIDVIPMAIFSHQWKDVKKKILTNIR